MPTKKTALEYWMVDARALEGPVRRSPVPNHVLMGEAVDGSKFVVKYWKSVVDPVTKRVIRPGLETLTGAGRISANIAAELLSLQDALQEATTRYLLVANPKGSEKPSERARFVLGELTAALEYLFDDGVEDEHDAKLASLSQAHRDDPETADALASELDDYALLASEHKTQLDGIGGFDAALIGEARTLAGELRQRPPQGLEVDPAARDAYDLRNRVAALLLEKMGQVRAAARYVFRHEPEVIREATSAYERRKRASARRAAKRGTGAGEPAPGGGG